MSAYRPPLHLPLSLISKANNISKRLLIKDQNTTSQKGVIFNVVDIGVASQSDVKLACFFIGGTHMQTKSCSTHQSPEIWSNAFPLVQREIFYVQVESPERMCNYFRPHAVFIWCRAKIQSLPPPPVPVHYSEEDVHRLVWMVKWHFLLLVK